MDWMTAARGASAQALASGALAPIDTRVETLTDAGVAYVVRVLRNVRRKRRAAAVQTTDPFAPPYETDLEVGALSSTHVLLLNKYPVLAQHLLAVTRDYEPQTNVLSVADCHAVLTLLHTTDGLVFYNGGPEAGASQAHKHLQMIPLSAAAGAPALPVATALAAGDGSQHSVGMSPALPFAHARVRMPASAWQAPQAGAPMLQALYLELLHAVGLAPHGVQQPGPYNLLATREWLWLVPRRCPAHQGIGVNALGFAGTLLVPDDAHLATLKALGPAACLRAVSTQ